MTGARIGQHLSEVQRLERLRLAFESNGTNKRL
jgi:hypothetical protein